jgi:hypothetical protein
MHNIQRLNAVVNDIFVVFENVRSMFVKWDRSYHMPFIAEVMKLQKLEVELYNLGYDEEFVMTVIKIAYHNVFKKDVHSIIPLCMFRRGETIE